MRFPMFGGLWPIRPRDALRDAFAGLTLASMKHSAGSRLYAHRRNAGRHRPLYGSAAAGRLRAVRLVAPSRRGGGFGDGNGFQTGRRQFERVTLSSVIATPDRRSRFRLDLAGQTELRQFGADLAKSRP